LYGFVTDFSKSNPLNRLEHYREFRPIENLKNSEEILLTYKLDERLNPLFDKRFIISNSSSVYIFHSGRNDFFEFSNNEFKSKRIDLLEDKSISEDMRSQDINKMNPIMSSFYIEKSIPLYNLIQSVIS